VGWLKDYILDIVCNRQACITSNCNGMHGSSAFAVACFVFADKSNRIRRRYIAYIAYLVCTDLSCPPVASLTQISRECKQYLAVWSSYTVRQKNSYKKSQLPPTDPGPD